MVRSLSLVLVFILTASSLIEKPAQDMSKIIAKKSELKLLKDEITSLEKDILNKNKKEKESYNLLQNYDKQNHLLNRIISKYRIELNQKENEITSTEFKLKKLSKEITRLQTNYANYVKAVYKKSNQTELSVIFNSESISQAIRRIFYLKKFSERRRKDLTMLEKTKHELASTRNTLEREMEEKFALVEEKQGEEKVLKKKSVERKKILNTIRRDKAELKKELDAKKRAEITIKAIIAKLNEEKDKRDKEMKEKLRLSEEKKLAENKNVKNVKRKEDKSPSKVIKEEEPNFESMTSFQKLKGSLIWPVSGGKIIRKFGENKNLILNTVTLNYGVDIKVSSDLTVRTVADGVISAIEWIPGYGSIIIISHSDNYRTVYSHLNEIYVQEGNTVKSGQTIASVGETIEGNILHFEIWNSRENQNPEVWLAKK